MQRDLSLTCYYCTEEREKEKEGGWLAVDSTHRMFGSEGCKRRRREMTRQGGKGRRRRISKRNCTYCTTQGNDSFLKCFGESAVGTGWENCSIFFFLTTIYHTLAYSSYHRHKYQKVVSLFVWISNVSRMNYV